jgi:hypothetical protein
VESPVSPEWAELDRIDKAMDEAIDAKDEAKFMSLDEEWRKVSLKVRRAWIGAALESPTAVPTQEQKS